MKKAENILVLTHWSYRDPLIQAYTLPYVEIIRRNISAESELFLITFEQNHLKLSKEEERVISRKKKENGIDLIFLPYFKMNIFAPFRAVFLFLKLLLLIITKRINTIHCWCMPAGAIGYILSKLTGKRLIIDSYEPQAEAMVENKTWKVGSFSYRLLFFLERKLSNHASILISATEGMRDYAKLKYGLRAEHFYVKPACVDLKEFDLSKRKNDFLLDQTGLANKIVCVYAGKFGGIYLTQEVFDFFSEAEKFWGDRFRVLLLTNHSKTELEKWATNSGFSTDKITALFIEHSLIPDYIGLGDFGITPVKPIPTKKYCTPIKDGEYWAMGLPVVITKNISDDSELILQNTIGAVINEFTKEEYQRCIHVIDGLLKDRTIQQKIRNFAIEYRSYQIAENIYRRIYGDGKK